MIKTCGDCFRFLPENSISCSHCHSRSLNLFIDSEDLEYLNYEIRTSSISIKGKEYQIKRLIDKGGFGTVLLVQDSDNKPYALKVSKNFDVNFTNNTSCSVKDLSDSFDALKKEIKNISQNPNATQLKIYAFGKTSIPSPNGNIEIPYILMEFAPLTLSRIIQAESQGNLYVPFSEKKEMMLSVLDSLTRIHKTHAHRDIKPGNIFCVEREGKISYIIGDFGNIALRDVGNITQTTHPAHTPLYTNPLLLTNQEFRYHAQCDFWSLGVVFSEIAIGNMWPHVINRTTLDVHQLNPLHFESEFLNIHKSTLEKRFYNIIKKSISLPLKNCFSDAESFHSSLNNFFKNHSSFLKSKLKAEHFFILFISLKIKLPFHSNSPGPYEIQYGGTNTLDFDEYAEYFLSFNNLRIINAKIKGTSIYKIGQIQKNRIQLLPRNDYFLNLGKKYSHFLDHAKGTMTFTFKILIECIRL